jgi:hypothetical protein
MTEVTVAVTQDHISRGTPSDCGRCPVALALLDAMPGAYLAEVCWAGPDARAWATVWLPRGTLTGWLGEAAGPFIHDYDFGDPVEPFTFTMHIPEEAVA